MPAVKLSQILTNKTNIEAVQAAAIVTNANVAANAQAITLDRIKAVLDVPSVGTRSIVKNADGSTLITATQDGVVCTQHISKNATTGVYTILYKVDGVLKYTHTITKNANGSVSETITAA